jgi:hypothetical protein
MKCKLTIFNILLCLNCLAQSYSQTDFTLYSIPQFNSVAWYKVDTSKISFSVSITDNRLQIAKYTEASGKECLFSLGTLVALDVGEWGGGLYFKPNDTSKKYFSVNGKPIKADDQIGNFKTFLLKTDSRMSLIARKHVLISPGNTQAVVPYQNSWIYIHSFTNMQGNHGLLSKLNVQNDSFFVSEILDLNAITEAIAVYKQKIFIVTYNGFYCINEQNGQWSKLLEFDELFWKGLYPNSIAAINERNIYVGMRGGYAKIDLKKKGIKFYMYVKKQKQLL